MIDLKGIFPPLPTSFNRDESISHEKKKKNILTLCSYPLSGFLILGSNGELVMLSEREKEEVYNTAREAIPADRLMIAGCGAESTRETIRLVKQASRAGADACLVLNPFYYKGQMDLRALRAHFHSVADASPVPVLIYNMPANTGIDMSADHILEIARHPNIKGLKDSGGNLVKMAAVINSMDEDFQVLAGSAGFLLPALSIGACGGILALANIAPSNCCEIYEHFTGNRPGEARKKQLELIDANTAVTRRWGVAALKAAMDHLGLYGGTVRKPLQELDDSTRASLIEILDKAGIESLKP